ncbi:MAG: hypothetical protein JSR80_00080 [Verrucomicrobia bacterium]|nr:hypothetical protein [Verrucomicrobiota bacterium]
MRVSLGEINEKLDDLIEERISREFLSAWAQERQAAEDANQLEYDPPNEEDRIWRAILYCTGVDLLDMDGSYLHSIDNFIDFRREIGLEDSCDLDRHIGEHTIRYSKKDFSNDLKIHLKIGCDAKQIGSWAHAMYLKHCGRIDRELEEIMVNLFPSEESPEFELTKKELLELVDNLELESDKEELARSISDIKEIAEDLGDNWLMCPLCQEAWEDTSDYAMVRCPKCNHRLHNLKFK